MPTEITISKRGKRYTYCIKGLFRPNNLQGLQSSVESHLKCRIEPFQLDASVVTGELPINAGLRFVPALCPGMSCRLHLVQRVNPLVQALPDENVDLNLGNVQPATVLWGVDKLKTIPESLGHRRGECLVERPWAMRVRLSMASVIFSARQ